MITPRSAVRLYLSAMVTFALMAVNWLWFSGGDLDGSTYMARLPGEKVSVICLSKMPTGDSEVRAKAVLHIALESKVAGKAIHD